MSPLKPNSGALALVTGASGFIATHIIAALLEHGFTVRGTVRSVSKGECLTKLFNKNFEYVIVEDIAKEGAFDDAVVGVQAVLHTASPFHTKADDPDEQLVPAKQGTLGVLASLKSKNPDVQRVILTSSVASIANPMIKPPHTFNENDWNTVSMKIVQEQGRAANGQHKYLASKTVAEEEFWNFFKHNKDNIAFDGVAINPTLVLGPIIHQVDKPESLNTSVAGFYQWLSGGFTEADLPAPRSTFVDVRDVALAHVRALILPQAAGERFITGNTPITGNDYVLAIHKAFPDIKGVPIGNSNPEYIQNVHQNMLLFDGSKAARVLQINYTSMEVTLNDMMISLKERFGI